MTGPAQVPLSGDELFGALVEATDAMTYVIDVSRPDTPPLFVSPQVEHIFGVTADDLRATPARLRQLVHPDDRERVDAAAKRALHSGEVFDEEFRVVRPNGRTTWVRDRARVLPARGGRPPMWVGSAIDVSARHQRQERAQTDAEHHRRLVEQLPGIVFRLVNEPPYDRVTYLSPQIQHVFGYPVGSWRNDPSLWTASVHADDRDAVSAAWRAATATETPFVAEYRVVRADGRIVWVRETTTPVRLPDGRVEEWQGLMLDVTDAHRAEERRALSDQRWRMLVENAPAIVFTVEDTENGGTTYVGPQLQSILGYGDQTWREDPDFWIELIHPEDRPAVLDGWAAAVHTAQPFAAEYRMRRADGTYAWISEHTHPAIGPDGTVSYWQGISVDVTATRDAQAALETTEARLRALLDQLPAVVYIDTDEPRPTTLFMSSASREILGYPGEAYMCDPSIWRRQMHPDDRPRVLASWDDGRPGGSSFEDEYRIIRPDGEVRWIRDSSVRIDGPDGERTWQGVILDVTRRVLAEQEAVAAGARYQALVERIPAVVYEMDPDDERRTVYVSPQIEMLLGYTRDEWLEQPDIWIELLHPDDRELVLEAYDVHNESGELWRREYRLIANDGTVVWVRDQAVLVHDADGNALTWQGVMFDVTAQKEAEEQLRRANDELEFRVRARTSQLADANELMSLEIGERRRAELELREAEERYRRLVEDIPAVVYIWQVIESPDGSDAGYISPQIEQLTGFTRAEWTADREFWISRLHPHDRDDVLAAMERAARTGEPFHVEFRYLAKDGRVVWVLDRSTLLTRNDAGEPFIFQGVVLDITARKAAEAKAAAAEARFRELADTAPVITYVFDVDHEDPRRTSLDYVSPQIAEVLGYPVSRWMDDPAAWAQVIHPDDRETVIATTRSAFATGAPWAIDYRVLAADGRVVWVHSRARCAMRDADGRPSRFVGLLVDVTDRQDAAIRARDDLAAASALLEGMPAIPWTEQVDPETGWRRFTYIGPQARELLGYDPEELIAEPGHFERMVHPDDRDRAISRSRRSDRTGELWVDEYRVVLRDGSTRWFHGTARRVTPDGVTPAIWQGLT
ncbi:MAG TPA: PAS domain-containing protein, partial [Actinomycetota bacterium]|nr:PAS domain-containing protein [Actinomycetota bacterium]